MENGRLLRLMTKLGTVLNRETLGEDEEWGTHPDRYLLSLFHEHLYHQVCAACRMRVRGCILVKI